MAKGKIDVQRIGRRIQAAREFWGWKPDELASRAGTTRQAIDRFERTGDLTIDQLERVAAALRLPQRHFLEECVLCRDDSLT